MLLVRTRNYLSRASGKWVTAKTALNPPLPPNVTCKEATSARTTTVYSKSLSLNLEVFVPLNRSVCSAEYIPSFSQSPGNGRKQTMPATDIGWAIGGQQAVHGVCHMFGNKRKNDSQDVRDENMCEITVKRRCTEIEGMASQNGATHVQQMEVNRQDPAHFPQSHQQHLSQAAHQSVKQFGFELLGEVNRLDPAHFPQSHQQHLSQAAHQPTWDSHMTHVPNAAGDHSSVFNNNNNETSPPYQNSNPGSGQCLEENNNQISVTQSFSQEDMIMDLTDEVYTTARLTALDPATVTTDAEYEAACSMMATMDGEGAPDPHQYRQAELKQNRRHDCIQQEQYRLPDITHLAGGDHGRPGRFRCLPKPTWTGDVQPYVSDYY